MDKEKELKSINVGIFGHIDHGKTTLLQKITGKWASTHSEELKRGITIKLGYADVIIYKDREEFNTEKKGEAIRHVSFVDAPGHEMLMATTLSGAALIDAAILVIAANEGIKPQTREHLMALQAKKIENIIVAQNKIDLVNKEQAKKNYNEIKEFLGEKYSKAEIIPVSAQQNANIDEILRALASLPIKEKKLDEKPIFIVARSFDINKPGTKPKDLHGAILGGILKQGILKVGDEIDIKPGRVVKENNQQNHEAIKTKIISLFKGSKKVDSLIPGGSASIETELDMALGKSDSLAGNLASHPNNLPQATTKIKINYELFSTNKSDLFNKLMQKETIMLSINTTITGGTIQKITNKEIEVQLKIPAVFFKGDNVGIAKNINGHWRLIGYGEVI